MRELTATPAFVQYLKKSDKDYLDVGDKFVVHGLQNGLWKCEIEFGDGNSLIFFVEKDQLPS